MLPKGSVLILIPELVEDFQKMTIISGMKTLFGHKCVDSIKQKYMYDGPQGNAPGEWNKGNLMGAGMG
jgi:hypothetical protein